MKVLVFSALVVLASARKTGLRSDHGLVPHPDDSPTENVAAPAEAMSQAEMAAHVVPEAGPVSIGASEPAAIVIQAVPPQSAVFQGVVPQAAVPVSVAPLAVAPEGSAGLGLQSDASYDSSKGNTPNYQPNWPSIDSRPLPSWYDDAKIGIFIHWGVYSVPSFSSEWFWIDWLGEKIRWEKRKISVSGRNGPAMEEFKKHGKPSPNPRAQKNIDRFMKANYKPGFTYQDFAKDFTAEFFDPSSWADLIENSGAKYVVFTSKHHEGYANWPSKYSYSWNSVDIGPHRDLVGELRRAILKKKGIRFGLYHSLYEWFHPLYLSDKSNNFTTRDFVDQKIYLEMKELVKLYRPDVFWSDGEWEAPSEYWRSTEFLAWLYNQSPVKDTVVVNDRWGQDTLCKHGGMFTCQDRYRPGKLLKHKWENAMTIDKNTWGFNRMSNLDDYLTVQELIDELASTVSFGGNIVMNVGPTKEGTISPIFQDRLTGVGKWLKVNGEAIYGSRPWDTCQNDTLTPNVWYTVNKKHTTLYAIMLRWPTSGVLDLACPVLTAASRVSLLDAPDVPLKAESVDHVVKITLLDKALAKTEWGSVIKITSFNLTAKLLKP